MANSVRSILRILLLVLVGGCSTEGAMLGSLNTHQYVNEGLARYGTLPGVQVSETQSVDQTGRSPVSGLIAIGAVSNFREITADNLEDHYNYYLTSFEPWESEKGPLITRNDFSTLYSGWTRVMIHRGFLFSLYVTALVTAEIAGDVKFEHPFRVLVDQSTGDLVAAVTNADGAFVIGRVLCPENDQFADCAAKYKMGVFDAQTGMELDRKAHDKLVMKEDGHKIDIVSFLPIP